MYKFGYSFLIIATIAAIDCVWICPSNPQPDRINNDQSSGAITSTSPTYDVESQSHDRIDLSGDEGNGVPRVQIRDSISGAQINNIDYP